MPGLVGGYGNYLLPVQCGAPDYLKNSIKLLNQFSFNNDIHSDSKSISAEQSNDIKHKMFDRFKIGSYLAGLFESDGHLNYLKRLIIKVR
jgi:hypothetical protein